MIIMLFFFVIQLWSEIYTFLFLFFLDAEATKMWRSHYPITLYQMLVCCQVSLEPDHIRSNSLTPINRPRCNFVCLINQHFYNIHHQCSDLILHFCISYYKYYVKCLTKGSKNTSSEKKKKLLIFIAHSHSIEPIMNGHLVGCHTIFFRLYWFFSSLRRLS